MSGVHRMNDRSILILGGYGGVGKSLSRLILKETDVDVIVAGRREEKAKEFAEVLNREYPGKHVTSRYADAADSNSLAKAFQGVDMVIVAATTPQWIEQVARAALNSGSDYIDILVQQNTIPLLQALPSEIAEAGRVFITQAGFHPGLPAVFVREAAPYFDDYHKAVISMAMNARFEKPESTHEIIHEVGESNAEILKDGEWRQASYEDAITVDFGSKFGIKQSFPLQMTEMKPLPEIFGIKEAGVYVAGFNWFVDNLVFPLTMLFRKIGKGVGVNFLGKLMCWGVNTFSSSALGVIFVLDAEGKREGKVIKARIVAEHNDAVFFTAVPVVACLKQYLDGSLSRPGVWLMGNAVDSSRLMRDMKDMGIQMRVEVTDAGKGDGAK